MSHDKVLVFLVAAVGIFFIIARIVKYLDEKHNRGYSLLKSAGSTVVALLLSYNSIMNHYTDFKSWLMQPSLEQENKIMVELNLPLISDEMYSNGKFKDSSRYYFNDYSVSFHRAKYILEKSKVISVGDTFINKNEKSILIYNLDQKEGKEDLANFYLDKKIISRDSADSTLKAWGMYEMVFNPDMQK